MNDSLNENANLIEKLEKVIMVMESAEVVSYRSDLEKYLLDIKNNKNLENSLSMLRQLIMSPKALQDISIPNMSSSSWLVLLGEVLGEL